MNEKPHKESMISALTVVGWVIFVGAVMSMCSGCTATIDPPPSTTHTVPEEPLHVPSRGKYICLAGDRTFLSTVPCDMRTDDEA